MFRVVQRWFYSLHVLKKLTRDKDHLLPSVYLSQIDLTQHGLGDAYKGRFGSGLLMPKKGSDVMGYGPGRVHARHGFVASNTRLNTVTTAN